MMRKSKSKEKRQSKLLVCSICSTFLTNEESLHDHLRHFHVDQQPSSSSSSSRVVELPPEDNTQNNFLLNEKDDNKISGAFEQQLNKSEAGEASSPQFFPVFRRPKKVVHLIRHGHTTYKDGPLRTLDGRHAFDVTLSTLGIQQARALAKKLPHLRAELILTSPLTRALQTIHNALDLIQIGGNLKVEVSELHSEHVLNSGDVGRPPQMLAREFPWLDFSSLKDVWWYSPTEAPNDPINGLFQSFESIDHLKKRVGIFRQYLISRPEQTIVVFGHSTFFKELSGRRKRMENCELLHLKI